MTCWRRLRDWQAAGVWDKLHLAMLTRLREHDQIDWSRASIDGASVASPRGARKLAQTQRIEENWAANGILSSTQGAFRWPSRSQGQTDMIR
jgi:transposase